MLCVSVCLYRYVVGQCPWCMLSTVTGLPYTACRPLSYAINFVQLIDPSVITSLVIMSRKPVYITYRLCRITSLLAVNSLSTLSLTVLLLHVMSVRQSVRLVRALLCDTRCQWHIMFTVTLTFVLKLHNSPCVISTLNYFTKFPRTVFARHRANIFIIHWLSNISFISFRVGLHIATRHACIRVVLIHRLLVVSTAWLSCCFFFICMHVQLEPASLVAAAVTLAQRCLSQGPSTHCLCVRTVLCHPCCNRTSTTALLRWLDVAPIAPGLHAYPY